MEIVYEELFAGYNFLRKAHITNMAGRGSNMSNGVAATYQVKPLMVFCQNAIMKSNGRKLCQCYDIRAFVAGLPLPKKLKTGLQFAMLMEQTECNIECPCCAGCWEFKSNMFRNFHQTASGVWMCDQC